MAGNLRFRLKGKEPHIYIDPAAHADMMLITRAVSKEIAWLGCADDLGDGRYRVYDVALPPQQSSGATVELNDDHLEEFSIEVLRDPNRGPEVYNKLRFWGHSHHTMNVAPSGQDVAMLAKLLGDDGDFYIAVRTNHKGEMEFDLATQQYTLENVAHSIGPDVDPRQVYWDELIKERVQAITYTPGKAAGAGSKWQTLSPQGSRTPHPKSTSRPLDVPGGRSSGVGTGGSYRYFDDDDYYQQYLYGIPDSHLKRLEQQSEQMEEAISGLNESWADFYDMFDYEGYTPDAWKDDARKLLLDSGAMVQLEIDKLTPAQLADFLYSTISAENVAAARRWMSKLKLNTFLELVDFGWEPEEGWA